MVHFKPSSLQLPTETKEITETKTKCSSFNSVSTNLKNNVSINMSVSIMTTNQLLKYYACQIDLNITYCLVKEQAIQKKVLNLGCLGVLINLRYLSLQSEMPDK